MIKMIYIIALLFCILLLILPFLPSQMGPHKTRARISHIRENIRYMMQAIGSYDSEHHTLKGIQEDPIACVEEFRRRNIAYRGIGNAKFTQDSWGNAFHILQTKIEGENYISIRSAGPDARFHTDDDIVGYYPFTPYGYEDAWGLKTMNIDKSVP